MQTRADQLEPGTVLAGKLRVLRLIGEGGMGAVYEVEHEYTKHRRAMKLLHPEMALASGVVARFIREASAAGRIGSPHIVETFDAGTLETGEPYIVMELLEGRPLEAVIAKRGRLDFRESIDIVRQACAGIQAAHDAGIVHRDLKPENLFLVAGDKPFVKILDFGISKFDPSRTGDSKLTQEGSALGTPFYMSPEQVRGESDLDGRTDVYALGVVLYECLTGEKPFAAETLPAIAVLIHEGKYQPLRALRPDAPPELEEVVARAIHVDRDARYATPAELGQALANVDILSAPTGAGYTLVAPTTELSGTPQNAVTTASETMPGATDPRAAVTGALPAGTDAGVASDAQPERRRVSKATWILAAIAAASVGLVVIVNARSGAPRNATSIEEESSDPVPAAPPSASAIVPAASPSITPLVDAPETEPSVSPSAAASSGAHPEREKDHSAQAPTPATPGMLHKPTRASEHGLAEDNPFQ